MSEDEDHYVGVTILFFQARSQNCQSNY